jgi:hypothetical protein
MESPFRLDGFHGLPTRRANAAHAGVTTDGNRGWKAA